MHKMVRSAMRCLKAVVIGFVLSSVSAVAAPCPAGSTLYAYKGNLFTKWNFTMVPAQCRKSPNIYTCNALHQTRLNGHVCIALQPWYANRGLVNAAVRDFSFSDGFQTRTMASVAPATWSWVQLKFAFDDKLNITEWYIQIPFNQESSPHTGPYAGPAVTSVRNPSGGYDVAEEQNYTEPPSSYYDLHGDSNVPGAWTGGPTCESLLTGSVEHQVNGPVMRGSFSPPGGTKLAALLCLVDHFNWQQTITYLPAPNGSLLAGTPPGRFEVAPPSQPDPPPDGMLDLGAHSVHCKGKTIQVMAAPYDSSYPFYLSDAEAASFGNNQLGYSDAPADPCLSGGDPGNPGVAHIEFTTKLVGVISGVPVELPVVNSWNWLSTYDGTSGGAYGLKNLGQPDSGSGTGGVDVLSINGVPTRGPCAANVTPLVAIKRGGFVFNMATGTFVQRVTLTNQSAGTMAGPISLVLDSLSVGASLSNASGTTWCSQPVASSFATVNSGLAPGQSLGVTLQFSDPARLPISYTTRVMAGPAAR